MKRSISKVRQYGNVLYGGIPTMRKLCLNGLVELSMEWAPVGS